MLSDLTTKRSIMLMLSVIMLIPFFNYETYWNDTLAYDTGISILQDRLIYANNNTNSWDFQMTLKSFINFVNGYSGVLN